MSWSALALQRTFCVLKYDGYKKGEKKRMEIKMAKRKGGKDIRNKQLKVRV
jgi:hypothetical protein